MCSNSFFPINSFRLVCCFIGGIIITLSSTAEASAEGKPNIILIQADDLGWDDLSLHGNEYVETPAIDRLGEEGIQFNHFYLNSVCAPTRASLLTGRHFLRTGVSHVHGGKDFINLDEKLLSESLKLNGYRTGMWGKWHSGKTAGYYPWERGFDEAYMAQLYKHENSVGLLNGEKVQHQKWASEVITDYAIDFINNGDKRPFFAYLSYLTVHAPLRAPEHLIQKYVNKGLSKNLATLYGMIDQLDSCLNVLFLILDKRKLTENTIVIFLSDNGPAYNGDAFTNEDRLIRNYSHFKGHKGNLWENGVKSPLLVKWPSRISARMDNRLISITDIYPTLVELAGGNFPNNQLPFDGKSFADYFDDAEIEYEKYVYDYVHLGWADHTRPYTPQGIPGEYNPKEKSPIGYPPKEQLISVRNSSFKLMQNPFPVEGTNFNNYEYILINTDTDPFEERDVKELYPGIFSELRERLGNWFLNILQEKHAFSSPEFIINEEESVILGYGPATLTSGLTNTGFYLTGWEKNAQSATYSIEIENRGKYILEAEFTEIAAPFLLHATIGYESTECLIEKSGKSQIGIFTIVQKKNTLILESKIQGTISTLGESKLKSLELKNF